MDPALAANFPGAQAVHVTVAMVDAKVPGSQSVHSADPAVSAYLPASQATQTWPPGPYFPVLQSVQSEMAVDPIEAVSMPGPQLVHVPAAMPEYVPIPQSAHEAEPAPAYLPATQLTQVAMLSWPVAELAVPAGQFVQVIVGTSKY